MSLNGESHSHGFPVELAGHEIPPELCRGRFFTLDKRPGPAYLEIAAPPSLTAGFTLRSGGVSRPPFTAANFSFGVGDDPAAVAANRRGLLAKVGNGRFRQLLTVRQVHGTDCLVVTKDGPAEVLAGAAEPIADAIISTRPGLLLGIQTADCLPLIVLAEKPPLAAVIHAGWRGLAAGIAARVVARIEDEFGIPPAGLAVYAGPAIGPCCFAVGPEVLEQFQKLDYLAGCSAWWRREDAGIFLDLVAIQRLQLLAVGLPAEHFQSLDLCTSCHDFCFSYRRDRAITGRQLAFAGIN